MDFLHIHSENHKLVSNSQVWGLGHTPQEGTDWLAITKMGDSENSLEDEESRLKTRFGIC